MFVFSSLIISLELRILNANIANTVSGSFIPSRLVIWIFNPEVGTPCAHIISRKIT